MNRFVIFLLSGIFLCCAANAQDISISASVDNARISLDQQTTLRITISGNIAQIPHPQIPQLPDFNVYSSGQSQSISIVNGKISSSVTFNFVLVPRKVGKFTIPAFSLQFGGKVYTTSPIEIEVVQGQVQPSPPAPSQPSPQTGAQLFVTGSVDKKTAYVNEQITYSFKFYRRVNLLSNPHYKPPDFTGFWVEDLPPQRTYYENLDGQRYFVVEVKTALFPTAPGEYTIGSASLVCNVEDFSPSSIFDDDFFRSFFSRGKTQTLTTQPIHIKVLPLPAQGKPQNFAGTVGKYTISAVLDKNTVEANQPVTLKVTISGRGNIKTISQPGIEELKGFRKYETITSTNISKENYIVQGSKTFTTMLVPQAPGQFIIPAIQTTYFDPEARAYRTILTSPITLNVKPGTGPAPEMSSLFTPKGVKFLGKDIRYLKTSSRFTRISGPLYEKPWFITFQILPLIILLITWFYSLHYRRLATDISYARLHRAYRNAERTLKGIRSNDPSICACTISEALTNYIADKLGLAAAGLTSQIIETELSKAGIDAETLKEVLGIIERCNFVRYAPASTSVEEIRSVYEKAKAVIMKLEKMMKIKKQ